ncbi:hypothetical protein XENOCAPTIV_009857, partial [Xenoophorus captivus]
HRGSEGSSSVCCGANQNAVCPLTAQSDWLAMDLQPALLAPCGSTHRLKIFLKPELLFCCTNLTSTLSQILSSGLFSQIRLFLAIAPEKYKNNSCIFMRPVPGT